MSISVEYDKIAQLPPRVMGGILFIMSSLNLIIIGRSGSGKGTQAELLVKLMGNLFYISSGQLFRRLSEQHTDIGQRVKKIVEEGGLPPDEIAISLWLYEIAYNVKPDQGIIFDGAPRKLEEAKHLDSILQFTGRFNNTKVLLIDISRDEAFKRLKLRARSDDTDEAIHNRLNFYEEQVSWVVSHYQEQGKLIKINGEQNIEKIHEDIRVVLNI